VRNIIIVDRTDFNSGTLHGFLSCWVSMGRRSGMAAPHVARVAGLVKDLNPNLNPYQVVSILKRTAEKLGSRRQFGHGMVDAAASVGVP